jgi:hypothetical protein
MHSDSMAHSRFLLVSGKISFLAHSYYLGTLLYIDSFMLLAKSLALVRSSILSLSCELTHSVALVLVLECGSLIRSEVFIYPDSFMFSEIVIAFGSLILKCYNHFSWLTYLKCVNHLLWLAQRYWFSRHSWLDPNYWYS